MKTNINYIEVVKLINKKYKLERNLEKCLRIYPLEDRIIISNDTLEIMFFMNRYPDKDLKIIEILETCIKPDISLKSTTNGEIKEYLKFEDIHILKTSSEISFFIDENIYLVFKSSQVKEDKKYLKEILSYNIISEPCIIPFPNTFTHDLFNTNIKDLEYIIVDKTRQHGFEIIQGEYDFSRRKIKYYVYKNKEHMCSFTLYMGYLYIQNADDIFENPTHILKMETIDTTSFRTESGCHNISKIDKKGLIRYIINNIELFSIARSNCCGKDDFDMSIRLLINSMKEFIVRLYNKDK